MSYDHVKQLQDHAARMSVEADWSLDAWLRSPTDRNALAFFDALNAADEAQQDLRRAVAGQLITAGN